MVLGRVPLLLTTLVILAAPSPSWSLGGWFPKWEDGRSRGWNRPLCFARNQLRRKAWHGDDAIEQLDPKGTLPLGANNVEPMSDSSNPEKNDDKVRRNLLKSSAAAVAAALLGTPNQSDAASTITLEDSEKKRIDIFERTAPSVVFIDTFTEKQDAFSTNVMEVPLGSGSGFVWDDQGHIVTNYHVVRNARTAQVAIIAPNKGKKFPIEIPGQKSNSVINDAFPMMESYDPTRAVLPYTSMRPSDAFASEYKRTTYKATVVGVDPAKDIAVLKIDAPQVELYPISVGTSKGLKVGQSVLAIGNPFGLDHTLTAGIISGTGREVKSPIGRPISNVIQTDASINPGNSGGPLLDSSGKLIGINTAIYSTTGGSAGIGFAIPVDTVQLIVETLIKDGRIVRPIIGISYLESKQALALGIGRGVLILDVPAGSPAAQAGLRGTRRLESGSIALGDIIVRVGGKEINTETDLFASLEMYKPGDRVPVTVSRIESFQDTLSQTILTFEVELQSSTKVEQAYMQPSRSSGPYTSPYPNPYRQ